MKYLSTKIFIFGLHTSFPLINFPTIWFSQVIEPSTVKSKPLNLALIKLFFIWELIKFRFSSKILLLKIFLLYLKVELILKLNPSMNPIFCWPKYIVLFSNLTIFFFCISWVCSVNSILLCKISHLWKIH